MGSEINKDEFEHRELLLRIKKVNKDTGKSDPVWK